MSPIWENLSGRAGDARLAIVADEASVSYEELLARAGELADALRAAGIGPGNVVLAYFENVPAFLVGLLASVRLGCAFAPLDVGLTDAEGAALLALAQSDVILCEPSAVARCERWSHNLVSLTAAGALVACRISAPPAPSVPAQIGCMEFSSGTTAASKGILISHEAFFHRANDLKRTLGLGAEDRTLCALPLSHTHGAECLALPTLLAGGTLYLKSPKFAFPLYVLEELERLRITFFSSIPQFYDFAVKLGAGRTPDLSALRLPFCGSAALSRATAEAFFARYGVHIRQGYGLAELSVICANMHVDDALIYDSVGTPIQGISWRLDGDGTEGELLVRSKAMFSGYINGEEATRERLRDGWLHTGDVVSVDEHGRFRIVGRKEDFIKVNAFKVYAAEVEAAIIAIDWIAECAVLGEKDATGSESIVAHVVPRDAGRASDTVEADLVRALRGVISDHKIPKRCVVWRELPKNPLGKILKAKIRASSTT